jgi:hypothetical protein
VNALVKKALDEDGLDSWTEATTPATSKPEVEA